MRTKMPIGKKIERFLNSKQCLSLVPLGSSATLPLPVKLNGKIFLRLLFYTGKKLENESRIKIYRPHTKIVLDYSNARIVNYADLLVYDSSHTEKWKEPIGEFPHKEIESLTLEEYKKRKSELLADYEKAIGLFNGDTPDANFKNDFRERFYQLCEPPLVPFMKKAGPDFFEWLN